MFAIYHTESRHGFNGVEMQQNYELSKKDTRMIQGLAVISMVCVHLFDTLDYEGRFVPLVFFRGYPLVFYFAQLSDFAVMAFAFCSGYGHMTQYGKPGYYKRRLAGLLGVYLNFWIILAAFTLVSMLTGNGSSMPGSLKTFIGNLTTVRCSYNGAWWYLFTYALIVFSSPVLLELSRKRSGWKFVLLTAFMGAVFFVSYYVRFRIQPSGWLPHQLSLYGMTAPEYMMGSLACEYKIFTRLGNAWKEIFRTPLTDMGVSVLLFVILLLCRTLVFPSSFFAPVSGAVVLFLFRKMEKPEWLQKWFLLLGRHSTNIWLTHMFFYLYIFTGFVYTARYPVLVLMLMLAVTIPVSLAVNAVHKPLLGALKAHLVRDNVPDGPV
jgi:hypothetical protein